MRRAVTDLPSLLTNKDTEATAAYLDTRSTNIKYWNQMDGTRILTSQMIRSQSNGTDSSATLVTRVKESVFMKVDRPTGQAYTILQKTAQCTAESAVSTLLPVKRSTTASTSSHMAEIGNMTMRSSSSMML